MISFNNPSITEHTNFASKEKVKKLQGGFDFFVALCSGIFSNWSFLKFLTLAALQNIVCLQKFQFNLLLLVQPFYKS